MVPIAKGVDYGIADKLDDFDQHVLSDVCGEDIDDLRQQFIEYVQNVSFTADDDFASGKKIDDIQDALLLFEELNHPMDKDVITDLLSRVKQERALQHLDDIGQNRCEPYL